MLNKYYTISTNKEDKELYTIEAYDNGDTYTHIDINENELFSLEDTYLNDGYINKTWQLNKLIYHYLYITGDNTMKLSIIELKEIKQQLDKGLTLCLPQSISLKQYDNIIKQIDNYINKEIILWLTPIYALTAFMILFIQIT